MFCIAAIIYYKSFIFSEHYAFCTHVIIGDTIHLIANRNTMELSY